MMSSRKMMLAGIASIQFRLPCEMLSVIWSISSWTRVTTKWLTQPDRYYSVLNFFGEFPLADQHSLGGRFVGGFIQVHFVHFHNYKPPFLPGLYDCRSWGRQSWLFLRAPLGTRSPRWLRKSSTRTEAT